jgi:hypothetical protein
MRRDSSFQFRRRALTMGGEAKNLSSPEETRSFSNGQMEIVKVGGLQVGRATFNPGWKWSNDVKPIAGTELCEFDHSGYVVSGQMKIVFKDGSELNLGPGDAVSIPAGHDGWVVGSEPLVMVDFMQTDADFAKPR